MATDKQIEKWFQIVGVHRLRVRQAGEWLGGIPDQLLADHDASKMHPIEIEGYADWFCGDKTDPAAFDAAWLHHQNLNPHHWEYWIPRTIHTGGKPGPLPMPEVYVREMIADWHAASFGIKGVWDISGWFNQHKDRIILHTESRLQLSTILRSIGYNVKNDLSIYTGKRFKPPDVG